MDVTRWQRLQQLFDGAVALPAAQRDEWLAAACPDDAELRRQAASLLLHDAHTTGVGEAILDAVDRYSALWEPAPEDRLGPYRVLRLLGRGGMGAVFLAERDDEQFRKTVAIKLVRASTLTPETLARFRAERQILATLDHPNIARLLDGGETANGTPYVVIEHVDGEPIDAYCDRRRLSIEDRLRLFRKICSAVHYAHQNLIVHRDLKPGNILVTGDGEPKLLEFGIAKLLDPAAAPQTLTQARVMTPQYASPEQIRGEPVTTAADVYALGVLLFELLTGSRPYQAASTDPLALQRAICEAEPVRPSSIHHELRGDLETILGMALRKEPSRRYASAEQFSEDLRRYLGGYPVLARADSWRYRAARFVQRNLAAAAAALASVVLLVAAVIAVSMQARRTALERDSAIAARAQAERARAAEQDQRTLAQSHQARAEAAELDATRQAARAREEAETARQVSTFLAEVFEGSDPFGPSERSGSIRDLVDRGARRLESELRDQPAVRASLLDTIGRVYTNLDELSIAEKLIREGLEARRALYGTSHPELAESLHNLALVLRRRTELSEAERTVRRAIAIRRDAGSANDLATSLSLLGTILRAKGEYAAAEVLARESVTLRRNLLGDRHPDTSDSYNFLGSVLRDRGDYAGAEAAYRRSREILRASLGARHPRTANRTVNLATSLYQQGRYDEAETLFREALSIYRAALGEHGNVANAINNLATVLFQKRDFDGAEPLYREALAMNRKLFGDTHSQTADALNNLGRVLIARRDFDAAEPVMREALETRRKAQGDDHPLVAVVLDGLGLIHRERGQFDAAEPLHSQSLAIRRARLRAGHPAIAVPLLGLAQVHMHHNRAPEAEPLLREALDIRRAALPAGHWEIAEIASLLGGCLTALDRFEAAEPLLLESYPVLQKQQGGDSRLASEARDRILALYEASHQPAKAREFLRRFPSAVATAPTLTPDR